MTEHKILSLGSCFSAEIGRRLASAGADILINPFGVLYNPASIAQSIRFLSSDRLFTSDDVIERDPNYCRKRGTLPDVDETVGHRNIAPCIGGYTSFYHHGSFTRATPEEFLHDANESLQAARSFFAAAKTVIVTFGTSYVYFHKEMGCVVSNCHKHPSQEFIRRMMSVDEIVSEWDALLSDVEGEIRRWIFTVSPIRHLKDGLHGNQISKSTLLLACDEICRRHSCAEYFPSYEIMMDELRDWKYYEKDGSHPSEEAVNIIFNRFYLP